MPDITAKLGIRKPLGNETFNRQSYNENLDLIDQNVETPAAAQAKAAAAETAAKVYTDQEVGIVRSDVTAHLAETTYLQEEEPANTSPTTLWFEVNGEVNFSEGGVAIENAQTSTMPPETFYWFEPI